MRYTFGKAFDHLFYLQDIEGNALTPSADAPAIYLYDNRPSRANVTAGSGAPIQTVVTWADVSDAKKASFAAVTDPDPSGSMFTREYWIGVKFTLATSGSVQVIIQKVWLSRAASQDSKIGTDPEYVKKICPRVGSYLTNAQIVDYIAQAFTEMRLEFEADGKKWAYLQEVNRFKLVLAYKAIELAGLGRRKREGDRHDLLAKEFSERYEKKLAEILAPYDVDGDGEVDKSNQQPSFILAVR